MHVEWIKKKVQMEDKSSKLEYLEYKVPLEDQFVFEKFKRSIDNCEDKDTLKYVATYLAQLATQRNVIIKGLISELVSPDNIVLKS